MKNTFLLTVATLLSVTLFAQTSLETSRDMYGAKVLKGFIDRKELAADTAFAWFAQTQKTYTPNEAVTRQYATGKDSINVVVFGGTWCDDTKVVLPKFYALADAAGIPENHITLIGVDRDKKSLFNLTEAFAIKNVPTFIVMKNGKEIGRVVEYGKTGMPEKEVGQIIATSGKK